MGVFELMDKHGHEEVVFCHDTTTGLRAIIAIHDTTLGPALGGSRMWDYGSEEEALKDALRGCVLHVLEVNHAVGLAKHPPRLVVDDSSQPSGDNRAAGLTGC